VPEAAGILRDVAKALAFAHANGVAHRDIKPDNVLLAGGSAVVTDFGIAKAIAAATGGRDSTAAPESVSNGSGETATGVPADPRDFSTLTQAGTSLGTPAYMAPEQAAGDPDADHRADIYSFGVVAYELLAGRHPFQDRAPHAMMRAHIAEMPEPLEDVARDVPASLAELVMQCLAKDPADRPQDAEAIVRALTAQDGSGERASVWHPRGRRRRRLLAGVAVAAGLVAVLGALAVTRGWLRGDQATLDDRVVAVTPFRVASADPSLHYLREGMLDLLAAKLTGQGGMMATEPRQMLDAWRRAGGSERNDLTREQALQLAGVLRAGRLLQGDVVGTPTNITISATLCAVPRCSAPLRVSEEGPPDSIAYIVDRLAARLLASTSSEGEQRVAQLSAISLPALRAYLDGQAKLRRGEAAAAAEDFTRALDADSTFALAGLGLHMATSWYGDAQLGARGVQVAWRERRKLSARDQAMLQAIVGPRYPDTSSTREIQEARETFKAIAPDRAEAWYLLGDHVFHYGGALGIADSRERALAHFKRAMELDSTYVVGYIHLLPLAVSLGDTATVRKVERLRLAADTSTAWHWQHRWYMAHRRGDTRAVRAVWDSVAADPQVNLFLNGVISHAMYDGTGASDVPRAVSQFLAQATSEASRRGLHRFAHDIALVLGRPAEALRHLESSADSAKDPNVRILKVRDALVGDGDTAAASAAARDLAALERQPQDDSAGRVMERAVLRVLEPWRLTHGDTTHTRRTLERLRAMESRTSSSAARLELQVEIAMIETMHAGVTGSPSGAAAVAHLDSLLDRIDYSDFQLHLGRLTMAAVVSARMHEARGDLAAALRAIRRKREWLGNSPYLAIQLREEGRLAALAGDTESAIRAYEHYVRLRANAEPRLRPQVDAVRRELARLESAGR
jgi:serine/threonine-protein kinase